MSLSKQSKTEIRKAITEMTKRFTTTTETAFTDFHFQVNRESGKMTIFDDDDNILSQAHITEWENLQDEKADEIIEKELRTILTKVQEEGLLDNMNLLKPYSCLFVDEDKETIVDLLFVDDETYIITDSLLEGFDEEMNEFLKHLLEE